MALRMQPSIACILSTKRWRQMNNRECPLPSIPIGTIYCELNHTHVVQAHPDSQGVSGNRDLRSVCCHSCKLQIFPVTQAVKLMKGQVLSKTSDSFDGALTHPPYIQELGRRLVEAAAKTRAVSTSQGSNHSAESALSNRDHMRAYLGSYLLTGD